MNIEQAYKVTKTDSKASLGKWFDPPKTRAAVSKWDEDELPAIVEREIKNKLSAQKQERAEAKKLKGVHKID